MTQATEDLEQDIAQTRTRLGDTIDRLQGSLSPSDVFDDLIGRRVEDGRGGLGHAATLRFPSPLIKPDVRICRVAQPLLAFAPTDPIVRRYRNGLFRTDRRRMNHSCHA